MDFIFEQIRTGGDRNLGYLIGDRKAGVAALVDPSYDPASVIDRAQAQRLDVKYIINTHGHGDHTNGNADAKRLTGAPIVAFRGSNVRPDIGVEDGQTLSLGSLSLEMIHVPGHTEDHVVVYLERERVAITGDHLFVGKIGGTGSDAAARAEFDSLKKLLDRFPDDVTIWPGHDYGCRPASTMALERQVNPFLLAMDDIEKFLRLKRDWADFKVEKGLK